VRQNLLYCIHSQKHRKDAQLPTFIEILWLPRENKADYISIMLRHFLLAGGLVSLSLFGNAVSAQGNIPSGEECDSDRDCIGSLDCIRTGIFKRCFPITCATGAAQAMVDFGFDPKGYINKVMEDSGMSSTSDLMFMSADDNSLLSQTLAVDVPPIHIFNENYTACMNRDTRLRGLRELFLYTTAQTTYGLQWSAAAFFSYFGKSTWGTVGPATSVQLVSNCIGLLAGGDAGVDFLIQIFSDINNLISARNSTSKATVRFNPGDTQYVPVFIAGPFGVQVSWFAAEGPTTQTITEITFGPSLGLALGGFGRCFNTATATSS
jgi:hypothetical protein